MDFARLFGPCFKFWGLWRGGGPKPEGHDRLVTDILALGPEWQVHSPISPEKMQNEISPDFFFEFSPRTLLSGPQKGAAERGHVKKSQSPKSIKNLFDTFRHFSCRAKNVKNRQNVSKIFWALFDNFCAAPVFRPLLGGPDLLRKMLRIFPEFCSMFFFCALSGECLPPLVLTPW